MNDGTYSVSQYPLPGSPGVRSSIHDLAMSSELIVTTPQPVYVLPRDHKLHGGHFYAANEWSEWHYWTAFVKDKNGREFALFYGQMPIGYNAETGNYAMTAQTLSIAPLAENRTVYEMFGWKNFAAKYPADGTTPADFHYSFSERIGDNSAGWTSDTIYYAGSETWHHHMRSTDPSKIGMDFRVHLGKPGYIPRTPTGIEEEGFSVNGTYNPQTMFGLSYYYIAPNMPLEGTITFEGETIEVTGSFWFEHQWGNLRTRAMHQEHNRWRWFSLRFDDGSYLAFRHWTLQPDNRHNHIQDHFCYVHPDGNISYGYGPSVTFTPMKSWTIPGSEEQWNMEGIVETPWGDYYMAPLVYDSLFIGPAGNTFWEGPLELRAGNSEGPVVGRAYCEQYFQPAGGKPATRMVPEQDLERERPYAGITPGVTLG